MTAATVGVQPDQQMMTEAQRMVDVISRSFATKVVGQDSLRETLRCVHTWSQDDTQDCRAATIKRCVDRRTGLNPRIGLFYSDAAAALALECIEPSGCATGEPGCTSRGNEHIIEHGANGSVGVN